MHITIDKGILLNKAANSCFIYSCDFPVLTTCSKVLKRIREQSLDDKWQPSFVHHQSAIMQRLRKVPQQAQTVHVQDHLLNVQALELTTQYQRRLIYFRFAKHFPKKKRMNSILSKVKGDSKDWTCIHYGVIWFKLGSA